MDEDGLWALKYYFGYVSNEDMRKHAILREERIKKRSLGLKELPKVAEC